MGFDWASPYRARVGFYMVHSGLCPSSGTVGLPTDIPSGIPMGHGGHGPFDLTMGQQWARPGGAHVGFQWASPSQCKSHGPTVAHGNHGWDLDGLAIWVSISPATMPLICPPAGITEDLPTRFKVPCFRFQHPY